MDAKALFQRSSGTRCESCRGGAILPFGSTSFRRLAEFGDQMDGTVAAAWRCVARLLAWPDPLATSPASVMAP
jgi:hypothetical protein